MDAARLDPASARQREILAELCNELKLPFIDPTDRFRQFVLATGQMPFGFDNAQPGSGHLNQSGHRIVADLLVEHIAPALSAQP